MPNKVPNASRKTEPKEPVLTPPTPLTDDQQYQARLADYKSRVEKLNEIFSFFEDGHRLEMFEYLQLIMDHSDGCATPVEDFITKLILCYGWADRGGHGLTMENIESELDTLKEDLDDAIRGSHFIASRYKKPEASNA